MTNLLQVAVDAASLGSLYALLALGVGLMFGVMRLVNFAQGDYITVSAYALILPSVGNDVVMFVGNWPWPAMVATLLLVATATALATERLVFRPMRRADPATLLIASFALSYLIQHLITVAYGARPKAAGILEPLTETLTLPGGLRVPVLEPVILGITIVLVVSLVLFLKFTSVGLQMRAAAEDFRMAQLLGIRANTVIAFAFAISGLLAGVVAVLLVAQTGVLDSRMGVLFVVYAFFGTVIGGMGSLPGSALGGFLIGALGVVLQAYLPANLRADRDAFLFGIVIVILLVRPQGLLVPRNTAERV